MQASVAKLMNIFCDSAREKEWTDETVESWNISTPDSDTLISYNHTHTPWPLKDRDFVIRSQKAIIKAERKISIAIRSTTDPSQPERDCCVRGEILDSTYVLREIEAGKRTYVTVAVQVDPKGAVPTWIANLFQKAWPRNTMEALRRQATKPDVKEDPNYLDVFNR